MKPKTLQLILAFCAGAIITLGAQAIFFGYRYHVMRVAPGAEITFREHRLTGSMDRLTANGWTAIASSDAKSP